MAAGGYDISASTARATAEAANQTADTVFNFSSPGTYFGGATQTATPSASGTAANRSPGTQGGDIAPPPAWKQTTKAISPLVWMIGAAVAIVALILFRK